MKDNKKIAIVGRPNVGKSTLFNRLIKSKKSIIDPTPGVTRDIVKSDFILNNKLFLLMDTGGLTDEGDSFNSLVQEKSRDSIIISDLVLFMIEAGNVLPVEEEYIQLLRKYEKEVIFIMNKSDSPEKDMLSYDYTRFGFGEPIPISAMHNRNIDLLEERISEFFKFANEIENEFDYSIDDNTIKIAIVGKPNVGKSSFLNYVTKTQRSIVSNIPGTTRDVVDEEITFDDHKLILLDTAGIRRKSKVSENIEYYSVNRAIKTIKEADLALLMLDSLDNISDQDKKITDQIVNNSKGLIILLNKIDLKNDLTTEEKIEKVKFLFPIVHYAPILPLSAINGKGIKRVLKQSIEIYKQLHIKITTSQLNNFIQEIRTKYSPSSKKGVLKIYYGVQTKTAPIEFIFFINNKKLLTENYKNYITNRLRETFGFTGIPIRIKFKNK